MRIAVGADHAGTPLNEVAIAELRRLGHEVVDLGTHDLSQPDDYPVYAAAVAYDRWQSAADIKHELIWISQLPQTVWWESLCGQKKLWMQALVLSFGSVALVTV